MRGKCCDAGRKNIINGQIFQTVAPRCTLSPNTFKVCIDEMNVKNCRSKKACIHDGEDMVLALTFADDFAGTSKTPDCKNR